MQRITQKVIAGLALGGCAISAEAALTLSGGNHTIQPAAGQTIELFVTGGTPIAGVDLAMQVGTGAGAPLITGIDLQSGIFASNHSGQTDTGSDALSKFFSISTTSGTVSGEGLLVRLTLDATGVPEGDYTLQLLNVLGFDSAFVSATGDTAPSDVTNGTINVIPEPTTLGVMLLAAMPLTRRRR